MTLIKEDKKKIEKLMQTIGNAIISVLPSDWNHVVIGYFIERPINVSHTQILYRTLHSDDYIDVVKASWDIEKYDDAIIEISDSCKELHSICATSGDDWSTMSFALERDGTFNIDYSYEPINKYNSLFILNWKSKYLV